MHAQMAKWGEDAPESTRDQIAAIMTANDAAANKKKSPNRAKIA